jgi:hypothetical protein
MEENIQNFRHVPETNAMRLKKYILILRQGCNLNYIVIVFYIIFSGSVFIENTRQKLNQIYPLRHLTVRRSENGVLATREVLVCNCNYFTCNCNYLISTRVAHQSL